MVSYTLLDSSGLRCHVLAGALRGPKVIVCLDRLLRDGVPCSDRATPTFLPFAYSAFCVITALGALKLGHSGTMSSLHNLEASMGRLLVAPSYETRSCRTTPSRSTERESARPQLV